MDQDKATTVLSTTMAWLCVMVLVLSWAACDIDKRLIKVEQQVLHGAAR